jgi:hypothetical protein
LTVVEKFKEPVVADLYIGHYPNVPPNVSFGGRSSLEESAFISLILAVSQKQSVVGSFSWLTAVG